MNPDSTRSSEKIQIKKVYMSCVAKAKMPAIQKPWASEEQLFLRQAVFLDLLCKATFTKTKQRNCELGLWVLDIV